MGLVHFVEQSEMSGFESPDSKRIRLLSDKKIKTWLSIKNFENYFVHSLQNYFQPCILNKFYVDSRCEENELQKYFESCRLLSSSFRAKNVMGKLARSRQKRKWIPEKERKENSPRETALPYEALINLSTSKKMLQAKCEFEYLLAPVTVSQFK